MSGWIGVAMVSFWLAVALLGPLVAPFGEGEMIADDSFLPPDGLVWLGSDYLGRDIFSRILWGTRATLGISIAATLLAYLVGVALGITAAVSGAWIDAFLSRVNDAILALPSIMLGLIVIAAFGTSIPVLVATTALVFSSGVFRLSRVLGQEIAVKDFVEVARLRGEGLRWIVTREILPNAAIPLAADFGVRIVYVILFTSGLSFLGLGVQPPMADWGSMVRENMQSLSYGSSASVWPAAAIASLTIAINLIVENLFKAHGKSPLQQST